LGFAEHSRKKCSFLATMTLWQAFFSAFSLSRVVLFLHPFGSFPSHKVSYLACTQAWAGSECMDMCGYDMGMHPCGADTFMFRMHTPGMHTPCCAHVTCTSSFPCARAGTCACTCVHVHVHGHIHVHVHVHVHVMCMHAHVTRAHMHMTWYVHVHVMCMHAHVTHAHMHMTWYVHGHVMCMHACTRHTCTHAHDMDMNMSMCST
jgi:hypothetical protein